MIEINNLTKSYHREVVLDINELTIENGQIFGLVGNNGAGKTTLFNLVLDLILPNKGKIINNGIKVRESEEWKEHTGAFIDESFLIDYLTAEEYFEFIGELRGMNKTDISGFLNRFTDFFDNEILGKNKFIRDFSKGNQKKAGIIAAFMGNPDVIVLDEPFANLDPSSQFKLRKIIKDLSASLGTTFLISSHTLDNIADVCSRIVILEKGKVVRDVQKTASTLQELESFFRPVAHSDFLDA